MKLLLVILSVMVLGASAKVIIIDNNSIDEPEVRKHEPVRAVVTQNLYIPMTLKQCDDATCQAVCEALNFAHGKCVSANTCDCY